MSDPKWNTPGEILGASSGYWRSAVLHAAVKLDLFTLIGDDALSGSSIGERTGCDERGITTLLNAIVALGLLDKNGDRFSNSEAARTFLVAGAPRYVGDLVRHHANLVESWARLEDAVRTGGPVCARSSGSSGATQEDFLRGMHTQAMGIAPRTAQEIDLSGRKTLLDLGGGPGTWAIHFAQSNPNLSATVFDLEGTRPIAEETIAQFGLSQRVSFYGGDFTTDDLPGGFDVAWLSHILHGEPPDACRALVRKVVSALNEHGLILIHEFILDPSGTEPLFPALFSLNMLVRTPGGRSYTRDALAAMLQEAGVREVRLLDFEGPTQSRILAGTR